MLRARATNHALAVPQFWSSHRMDPAQYTAIESSAFHTHTHAHEIHYTFATVESRLRRGMRAAAQVHAVTARPTATVAFRWYHPRGVWLHCPPDPAWQAAWLLRAPAARYQLLSHLYREVCVHVAEPRRSAMQNTKGPRYDPWLLALWTGAVVASSLVAACVLFVLGAWLCVLLVHRESPVSRHANACAAFATSVQARWKRRTLLSPVVHVEAVRLVFAAAPHVAVARVEVVLVFFLPEIVASTSSQKEVSAASELRGKRPAAESNGLDFPVPNGSRASS
jgi:hypothetical protein